MTELVIIRILLGVFVLCLLLSGITAIPLETELGWLREWILKTGFDSEHGLLSWISKIHQGLSDTNEKYPFMAYVTDWLAFAHFVIAVAFIGPLRDPSRNIWVIEFGMIACCMVVPFALVAGEFRGIPLGWRFLDCAFGLVGLIPLWYSRLLARKLDCSLTTSTRGNSEHK